MNPIAVAVVSVSVIGLLAAAILSVASKVMAVKVDEMFPKVRELLPGANCGACGFAGCDAYAQALVADKTTKTNLCVPGGDEVSRNVSAVLGVEFEDVVEQVSIVKCRGDCEHTTNKMEYHGIESCKAAKLFYGGHGACSWGCLGFGDCAKVCPYQAICIENGIAHIDPRRCVGCGLCTTVCPNHVIEVIPDVSTVFVACNSKDKGALVRKVCSAGCIGCKRCEKACPSGAITVENNVAHIDQSKCTGCKACAEQCPVGCITVANLDFPTPKLNNK